MNIQVVAEQFRIDAKRVDGLFELGFSKQEIYALVAPQRTLARRKDKLSLEESDKVERLQRVMVHAMRVLGDLEKSNRWLRKPNRALEGSVPITLLSSETGALQVKEILGRIEYGMFS